MKVKSIHFRTISLNYSLNILILVINKILIKIQVHFMKIDRIQLEKRHKKNNMILNTIIYLIHKPSNKIIQIRNINKIV
jgi:hypothetical protein